MSFRRKLFATFLSLAPLAVAAQSTDKPAEPAPADAKPAAAAPAPAPAAAPAKPPPVTLDFGGWLILNSWTDKGALNASDLPRFALPDKKESATGMSVRQSRFRVSAGMPDEIGLLGNAAVKGFLEVDFVGGYSGGDESAPLPRIRHAYVTSTWKDLGNLTLLAGQTTDIFHGSVAAASLSHLVVPRFGGAGYLYRRAPQVRLSGEMGKDLALGWQVGAISNTDKATQTASATGVGYRSSMPEFEGRVAILLRGSSPVKVELGAGARYAEEKWLLSGAAGAPNQKVKSQGAAADVKVDAGMLTLVGGAFTGENLDVANSLAPGVLTTGASPNFTAVKSIKTKGAWGQLQLTPVKGLQLLAGAGIETPRKADLPTTIPLTTGTSPAIDRNVQLSAGAIVNVTSKWRLGAEYTRYQTHTVNDATSRSNQLELSSLLAF